MIRDVETALGDLLRRITDPTTDSGRPVDPSAFLEVVGCLTTHYVEDGFGFDGSVVQDAAEFLRALLRLLMDNDLKKSGSTDEASTQIRRLFGGTTGEKVSTCNTILCTELSQLTKF